MYVDFSLNKKVFKCQYKSLKKEHHNWAECEQTLQTICIKWKKFTYDLETAAITNNSK